LRPCSVARVTHRPFLNSTKFQTHDDWWGYVVLAGAAFHLDSLKLAPLRWHLVSERFQINCALYRPSEHGPFISSCVGHGEYLVSHVHVLPIDTISCRKEGV
jgi:hypothetical protein